MSYPSYNNEFKADIKVGDKTISIIIGKFSEQAGGAVLAQCGETVVHTTVAMGRESNLGYFPLSVDYAEKLYAGGIIKGSRWVKRDGRPTDEAILKSRVTDRTIRPLFPEGFMREVQVVNTVFSYDKENEDDMIGMLATGIALTISEIPFDDPMTGVRVGYIKAEERFILNPTQTEREICDLDLIVGGTEGAIAMVEAGANEVTEEIILQALALAQETITQICIQIKEIAAQIGKTKIVFVSDEGVFAPKRAILQPMLAQKVAMRELVEKQARFQDMDLTEIKEEILAAAKLINEDISHADLNNVLSEMTKAEVRSMILKDGIRPDGRITTEVRPIFCEVDVFPRTHGSAMFKRGATQAVSIVTLASPALGQLVEDMGGETTRRYMHHYNMPPYASGEAGRMGAVKRREVGHGALAERALFPMIPSQEEFPYTIHVVSEILSSNGSTSQASVCGSTLSLMAAGVPLKKPVAGIAMGMISDLETGKNVVLSDIKDVEDHCGDMDFKVAGTAEGITAIQMDIKVKGIDLDTLQVALTQAKESRMHIMAEMMKCISEPRTKLSKYAPKIVQITIPGSKIGGLIGPGGKNIKAIIERFGCNVDIEEDEKTGMGMVNISGTDEEKIKEAFDHINNMMYVAVIGDEFDGEVTRVEAYGAFVAFLPGQEGLVHVSGMSKEYVRDAADIVNVGDKVHVRVSAIQDDGKIKLSMLTAEEEAEAANAGGGRGGNGGGRSGGYTPGGGRGDGGRGNGRGDGRGRGSRDGGGQDMGGSYGRFRR